MFECTRSKWKTEVSNIRDRRTVENTFLILFFFFCVGCAYVITDLLCCITAIVFSGLFKQQQRRTQHRKYDPVFSVKYEPNVMQNYVLHHGQPILLSRVINSQHWKFSLVFFSGSKNSAIKRDSDAPSVLLLWKCLLLIYWYWYFAFHESTITINGI